MNSAPRCRQLAPFQHMLLCCPHRTGPNTYLPSLFFSLSHTHHFFLSPFNFLIHFQKLAAGKFFLFKVCFQTLYLCVSGYFVKHAFSTLIRWFWIIMFFFFFFCSTFWNPRSLYKVRWQTNTAKLKFTDQELKSNIQNFYFLFCRILNILTNM